MAEGTGDAPGAAAVRLYTKRWWWIPAAFFGGVFVIVGIAVIAGGAKHNSHDVIVAVGSIVMGFVPMLLGLYYLLTPIPLLVLDQRGISYQTSPLVIKSVRWEDIEVVRAFKSRYSFVRPNLRAARLVVTLEIRPQTAAAYGNRRSLMWTFAGADLPIAPEQMVERIRRFHPVNYVDQYSAPPARAPGLRGPSLRHAGRSSKRAR